MICYRDMTFCDATDCKNFPTCYRALTDDVRIGAETIDLPICKFSDPTKNECYQPEDKNEVHNPANS